MGWDGRWQKLLKNMSTKAPQRHGQQSNPQVVIRPGGHHSGLGYHFRLMLSIWCAPQAPLCLFHTYTVLKAALRKPCRAIKSGYWIHSALMTIENSYKLGRNYFHLWFGYCLDSHILIASRFLA